MARSYAQVKVSLWDDDSDFLALSPGGKLLYLHLISRRDLSPAGHLYVREARWAAACSNGDTDAITDAITDLLTGRYVLIDSITGELLIRTFIFHDDGWRNPKMVKAIESAIERIESPKLSTYASECLSYCVANREALKNHLSDYQPDQLSEQVSDPSLYLKPVPATSNLQPDISTSVDKRVCQSRVTETGPRSIASNLTQLLGEIS